MKKKAFIIGNFGYSNNQVDGQTVKTRNIKKLLERKGIPYDFYDTSFPLDGNLELYAFLNGLKGSKYIFMLLNKKGLVVLFPFLYFVSKISKKKIVFLVVGGWLAEFTDEHPLLAKLLKRVESIMVETDGMKKKLESQNFNNIEILRNFKLVDFNPPVIRMKKSPLNMVFLSRVRKDKGLDVINELFDKHLDREIYLDIYGPIHTPDREFLNKVEGNFKCISYKGILDLNQVHEKISSYDLLLFPTHYEGEGFPGVILDALIAGLPVVASDWKYNSELIEENKTGYLFNLDNIKELGSLLSKLDSNRELLVDLKKKVQEIRLNYHYDKLSQPLMNKIHSEN